MELYHGSEVIVKKPIYGFGRSDNDYGSGFYCTQEWDMAAEWAAHSERGGFVNQYQIDTSNLTTLDLLSEDYHILHWLSILISNRIVRLSSPVEKRAMSYITERYHLDTTDYDIIKGYRADDSYFSFVRAFLSNTITIEQLSVAMRLGDLGTQYMIQSSRSFDKIRFIGYDIIDGPLYYDKRISRDSTARNKYYELLDHEDPSGHTVREIMKGAMSDDDIRLL